MLEITIVVAFVLVVALFLSALIIAVLDGQQSQRRQIGNLKRDIRELNNRLKSPSERRADAARTRAIEENNRRNRELYEHGGC